MVRTLDVAFGIDLGGSQGIDGVAPPAFDFNDAGYGTTLRFE